MKRKKTHWLRTTILVLAVCCVIGLALSAVQFLRDPGSAYASAVMVFTFDGAAAGTAPNGAAFDVRGMTRDEVLSEGLRAAGLEGVYTPEQLRANLVIQGLYPDNMADKVMHYESLLNFNASRELTVGDYHPTSFSISLYNDFDRSMQMDKLKTLLGSILDAYRSYFSRVYAFGLDEADGVFDLADYDYPQQLEIIEGNFTAVSGYAQELYERDPAFRFGGVGFNDISVRMNALIDGSITRLNANLTINALTRDADRLLTQYEYQIFDLGIQRDKQEQELEKLDRLIASYEKNEIIYLSNADSLTKIDGNSSETYDVLVNTRKKVADGITDISAKIANYELMIQDLVRSSQAVHPEEAAPEAVGAEAEEAAEEASAAAETAALPERASEEELAETERRVSAQRALLEESIKDLINDGDQVIRDFEAMLAAYNGQQISDQTIAVSALTAKVPRLLSVSFAKQALKTAGPFVALGFMVCTALIALSRRREEKEAE